MLLQAVCIVADFTSPEQIGTSPQHMLWLLPLTAAIAVVYKATKLPKITAATLLKEAAVLFGSIMIFVIAAAVALYFLAWLITE